MVLPEYDLIVVTGATASGKTGFAALLASKLNGEIISADSRQVYREMNLGTGKDYEDYIVDGQVIPHHLVDIVDPGFKYNVYEYQRDFYQVYQDMNKRGVFPVICGGSGMYIDSIISGYKLIKVPVDYELRKSLSRLSLEELSSILNKYKRLHNVSDIDTKKRAIRAIEIEEYYSTKPEVADVLPPFTSLIVGIKFDRDSRRKRISQRLKARLENGMVDEVISILESGVLPEDLMYYGLEYKYITMHVTGEISFEDMRTKLETAIHQFAKRQMTWFRSMERKGVKIHWLDGYLPDEDKLEKVQTLLNRK